MSKKRVIETLRADGWTIRKDEMLCPKCNGSKMLYPNKRISEVGK